MYSNPLMLTNELIVVTALKTILICAIKAAEIFIKLFGDDVYFFLHSQQISARSGFVIMLNGAKRGS